MQNISLTHLHLETADIRFRNVASKWVDGCHLRAHRVTTSGPAPNHSIIPVTCLLYATFYSSVVSGPRSYYFIGTHSYYFSQPFFFSLSNVLHFILVGCLVVSCKHQILTCNVISVFSVLVEYDTFALLINIYRISDAL